MKKTRRPVDGFIPRQQHDDNKSYDNLETLTSNKKKDLSQNFKLKRRATKPERPILDTAAPKAGIRHEVGVIDREDVRQSLDEIDQKQSKKDSKKRKSPKHKINKKKLIKRILLIIGLVGILIGGYLGVKTLLAFSNIFQGGLFDIFKSEPLRQDANGRTNIVIFGTAEDSEGGTHEGGNLTDSIMVVSLNQEKKQAATISLPRDLYVKHDKVCPILGTTAGKLNETYFCGSNDGKNEEAGAEALRAKAGEILGLDIQYHVHVNFTVVSETVDAVGGVDIKIESDDPRGIYDPNFDWQCNHRCNMVKYKNGEIVHLDGQHALALARARNAQGGYGLAGGNFDREKNQQKIIKAMLKKSFEIGTLANVGKITSIMDALGNNLRTNFQSSEVRTLSDIGQGLANDNNSISSISLNDENNPMVITGNVDGASIVRPVKGLYQYSDIHFYIKQNLSSNKLAKESAKIMVLNSSGVAGAAKKEADKLEETGLNVVKVGDISQQSVSGKQAFYFTKKSANDNPVTKKCLEGKYGELLNGSNLSLSYNDDIDFVVVVGR